MLAIHPHSCSSHNVPGSEGKFCRDVDQDYKVKDIRMKTQEGPDDHVACQVRFVAHQYIRGHLKPTRLIEDMTWEINSLQFHPMCSNAQKLALEDLFRTAFIYPDREVDATHFRAACDYVVQHHLQSVEEDLFGLNEVPPDPVPQAVRPDVIIDTEDVFGLNEVIV